MPPPHAGQRGSWCPAPRTIPSNEDEGEETVFQTTDGAVCVDRGVGAGALVHATAAPSGRIERLKVPARAGTKPSKKMTTKAGPVKVPRVVPKKNNGDKDGEEGDDEETVEPKLKRHSLLHAAAAGAIPKMLHAVVDTTVGLVVGDLLGQGPDGSGAQALTTIHDEHRGHRHRHKHEDDEESEEEDKLEEKPMR
ncbi:hypothetical protein EDB85DRAFT_1887433 [Lactarius pseudohatsudake]|nr:hypothetical protein EDB85DRAFT_1887433 [Lactarius pseudohatsudake]